MNKKFGIRKIGCSMSWTRYILSVKNLKLMVTKLTAVKMTLPTIKMIKLTKPILLSTQKAKTRMLQQQPQDGMNVWYLLTVDFKNWD